MKELIHLPQIDASIENNLKLIKLLQDGMGEYVIDSPYLEYVNAVSNDDRDEYPTYYKIEIPGTLPLFNQGTVTDRLTHELFNIVDIKKEED